MPGGVGGEEPRGSPLVCSSPASLRYCHKCREESCATPLRPRPLGIDCSLRLGLKALVHLAAWTAHHKDHLAQDRLEATHAFLSGTRRPGCLPVSSCRRSPVSATTSLDRIGVGIDTARYGHRVSFL